MKMLQNIICCHAMLRISTAYAVMQCLCVYQVRGSCENE